METFSSHWLPFSDGEWWYGIFQYHTTIQIVVWYWMNSGMILENTIPPFSIGNHFWYVTMGQYSDPWGGVISKYRPIFEKFWSNTYRRPKAGGMYWLDQNFEKRGLYLLITPSQGSLYSHCNIPKWFSYLSNLI